MRKLYVLLSVVFFLFIGLEVEGNSDLLLAHTTVSDRTEWRAGDMFYTPPADTQHGLIGSYYKGEQFNIYKTTRVDSLIEFDWGNGSPFPAMLGNQNFSIRWVGYIKAPVTGLYTFYTNSDDGARVIIDGLIFIDYWEECCSEHSGQIYLEAGKLYPFVYEFREGGGGANAKYLDWEAPGLSRELVPHSAFYAIEPPTVPELPKPDISKDTLHGLVGYYYVVPNYVENSAESAKWFDSLVATRIEDEMDFDWGSGSPMPGRMPVDYFAVRWIGYIKPPVTGTYTFHTWTDDGSRLFIDGKKIIDYWTSCCSDHSGTINLDAGKLYRIRLDLHEVGGGAASRYLEWEAPGLQRENIPNEAYYTLRLQTVFQPTISPVSAIYVDSVVVTLNTLTSGSTLHYTLDGSEPTESSPIYTAPITIKTNTKVRAVAFHKGMVPSVESSATYSIIPPPVSLPTFTPGQGIYGAPINVKIKTKEDSTIIYYTLDGSNPDTTSMVYTTPILIDSTTRMKAFAIKSGLTSSQIASATFTLLPAAASAPVFSPAGGAYSNAQEVVITSDTPGVVIHYAFNDDALNEASPVYTSPIEITNTTTLKAYAVKEGLRTSQVTIATYKIGNEIPKVDTPQFSLPSGHYKSVQQVAIFTDTKDADIYYTTDGSNPNDSSAVYFSPILITDSVVLKAYAAKPGMDPSEIISATYVVNEVAKDTGVITADLPTPELTLAPNPATNFVRISWTGMIYERSGTRITVTDSKGVIMREVIVKGGYRYYNMSTTTFADGLYFIRIQTGQSVAYGKLIIGR